MGLTRTHLFTEGQNEIASIMKVMGHPARIAILEHLMNTKVCICGDLVSEIGLAQATISQHLKELKKIGIIKGEIEGTSVCYCIDEQKWDDIQDIVLGYFDKGRKLNSCC